MTAADTIFAPATGAGRAAIAVLRISGPDSAALLTRFGRLPPPRRAVLAGLRGADGTLLDRAVVVYFPAPASHTGEDCAELHLHGGAAVIQAVATQLLAWGARLAEPGEFTRRAFLNGKMDLLEAEGVADLIDAETESQRRQAMRQMEGALSAVYADWAGRLRQVLAFQHALIDFPDEDLPPETEAGLRNNLARLQSEMAAHLDDAHRGEKLRAGLFIAIVGAPNVGKSSLINTLTGRDVAIVTPTAGTTRDALEARLDIAGVPVTLVDTAGLRDTADPIEAEGVRRAEHRLREADLVLALIDAAAPAPPPLDITSPVLRVANKTDLARAPDGWLGVSLRTMAGLPELRRALADHVVALTQSAGPPPLTRARHRAAIAAAADHLRHATTAPLPELRAEELQHALSALGRVTGHVGVEDLLDTIFSSFCIGK